jgi:hypothetical protein
MASSSSSDEGFSDASVSEDLSDIRPLLRIIYAYFVRPEARNDVDSCSEALMTGLGYIYYCKRVWNRSNLLRSLQPTLDEQIPLTTAGDVIDNFYELTEVDLEDVVSVYAEEKVHANPV